jgi:hypothetical protein
MRRAVAVSASLAIEGNAARAAEPPRSKEWTGMRHLASSAGEAARRPGNLGLCWGERPVPYRSSP